MVVVPGESAYKSESEYATRGFREGADDLLQILHEAGATTHLITAGAEELQKRKIQALDLDRRFDQISMVPMGGKEDKLREIKRQTDSETLFHIGNSRSSDVETALAAGVPVIYLPSSEWRNTENNLSALKQNPDVYIYESIPELLDDIDQILQMNVEIDEGMVLD